MLRLTVFEFIARGIPEAGLIILASVILSNTKIHLKRYIISSMLFATCVYTVRMLPINYGVHTILNIMLQNIILIIINKIDIISAIKSSVLTSICLFIIEILNMLILNSVFKEQLEVVMSNTVLKTLYGLPSLGVFLIIILCYSYYLRKRDKFKYV